ncbi:MAG: hypothetical protein JW874_14180 [Spirochaetales bacterium]|nr:hypothetical protein [Spirochaetales bacterium]
MTEPLPEKQTGKNAFLLDAAALFPRINRKEIHYSLGYKGKVPDSGIERMIEDVISVLPEYTENKAGYAVVPAMYDAEKKEGIRLGGIYFRTERIIAGQLRHAEQAAVFVCTIGSRLETWAAALGSQGDPAMSFIVDIIASVYVEALTDLLHDHIAARMEQERLSITNRFSPGYCGWDVSEQYKLFSLLPAGFCGIGLTESAFMRPRKSVSGVIGIGSAVTRTAYLCDSCNRENCIYRLRRLDA